MEQQISIGRVVHVRIKGKPGSEEIVLRPATVVRVWTGTTVNVQVQLDGHNDDHARPIAGEGTRGDEIPTHATHGSIVWATSISQGDDVGQWRWPAR